MCHGQKAQALGTDILLLAASGQRVKVASWDTVGHAHEDVTGFVRSLTACFDMRNGTTGVGRRVEHLLS